MKLFKYFKIRISLDETGVWRTFVINGNHSFKYLHNAIQIIMGWKDAHLYEFKINDISLVPKDEDESIYGEFDENEKPKDSKAITLEIPIKKLLNKNLVFKYTYDFGDNWKHTLMVEDVYDYTLEDFDNNFKAIRAKMPVECLDGGKNCPPEDVGGTHSYFDFVESMNTKNKSYDDNLNWYGKFYDENKFDKKKINQKLKKEFCP